MKLIITILLLVFVAASVVALFIKGSGDGPDIEKTTETAAGSTAETAAAKNTGSGESAAVTTHEGNTKIIAYYFHGNARCKTCLTIEMYALEALETGFPEALKTGGIEFLSVNLDIPENEHFIDDFQLAARTIVLEKVVGGERKGYINLLRVWELVGNKEAYIAYVRSETGTFMNGES